MWHVKWKGFFCCSEKMRENSLPPHTTKLSPLVAQTCPYLAFPAPASAPWIQVRLFGFKERICNLDDAKFAVLTPPNTIILDPSVAVENGREKMIRTCQGEAATFVEIRFRVWALLCTMQWELMSPGVSPVACYIPSH